MHLIPFFLLLALLTVGAAHAQTTRRTPTRAAPPAKSCKTSERKQWIEVHLVPPAEKIVTAVTVDVDYPEQLLSIPENKNSEKVKNRIGRLPANAILGVNDSDSVLKVVLAKPGKLPAGEIFTVEFDRCADAERAVAEDFTCTVEAAANASGAVPDVTCAVKVP
jgi:hypothetical protein